MTVVTQFCSLSSLKILFANYKPIMGIYEKIFINFTITLPATESQFADAVL